MINKFIITYKRLHDIQSVHIDEYNEIIKIKRQLISKRTFIIKIKNIGGRGV